MDYGRGQSLIAIRFILYNGCTGSHILGSGRIRILSDPEKTPDIHPDPVHLYIILPEIRNYSQNSYIDLVHLILEELQRLSE